MAGSAQVLRVDARRTKRYRARRWPAKLPEAPYAVHVRCVDGLVHTLVLDFDDHACGAAAASSARAAAIAGDVARVCGLLDQAGIRYAVAASRGPDSPRRHVLATFPAGAEPGTVRVVARALAARAASLDCAQAPGGRTAAVRPPYAPHAAGDRSVPVGDPAGAVAALHGGNPPEALSRLAELLGADLSPTVPTWLSAAADSGARPPPVVADRLPVARRPLGAVWEAVLIDGLAAPEARRRGWPSRSELAYALIVRMVACGRTRAEITTALLDPRHAGGDRYRQIHLGRQVYVTRPVRDRDRRLDDDITAALRYLTTTPPAARTLIGPLGAAVAAAADRAATPPHELVGTSSAGSGDLSGSSDPEDPLDATVGAILAWLPTAPLPARSGVAVRQLLRVLCLTAQTSGTLDLACPIRATGLRAGLTRSVVARLLHLAAAAGVLRLVQPHAGTQAAVWRLQPPTRHDTAAVRHVWPAQPPNPAATGTLVLAPVGAGGQELVSALRAATRTAAHPLFDHAGMGPESGAVLAAAVYAGPPGATRAQLAAYTGLTSDQTDGYVRFCVRAALITIDDDGRAHPAGADLDDLADRLGATEVVQLRRATYQAESAVWAWYQSDFAARRGWTVERARIRARTGRPAAADQPTLPGLSPTLGHYPRIAGRANHAEALGAIRAYLAA